MIYEIFNLIELLSFLKMIFFIVIPSSPPKAIDFRKKEAAFVYLKREGGEKVEEKYKIQKKEKITEKKEKDL